MADRIYISKSDLHQLRSLIDAHWTGRDGEAAQRLSGELDRTILVDVHQMPSDVVRIESRVTFEETQTGAVREVVLVYPSKADASAGRVSVLAPIGAALLGLRVGDRIEWPLPDGSTARIRIFAVAQAAASRRRPPRREDPLEASFSAWSRGQSRGGLRGLGRPPTRPHYSNGAGV